MTFLHRNSTCAKGHFFQMTMISIPSWLTVITAEASPFALSFRLLLYIQPGAKKTECVGTFDGRLKVKIHAPPEDGKANAELLAFIAKKLDMSKKNLLFISGEKSRIKVVQVDCNYSLVEVLERLGMQSI